MIFIQKEDDLKWKLSFHLKASSMFFYLFYATIQHDDSYMVIVTDRLRSKFLTFVFDTIATGVC